MDSNRTPSPGECFFKTNSSSSPTPSLLNVKSRSNIEYTIERTIGRGGYGTVFSCFDLEFNFFAMKAQKSSAAILESQVLHLTEKHNCKHFPKIIDEGYSIELSKSFLIMDMLGPSLSELKNMCKNRHFTTSTGIRLSMQTLNSIEELHQCGYLSRDIKPSNFVSSPKPAKQSLIYMIDFGIAKQYKDLTTNKLFPERIKAGFRGTARYCSIRNHYKKDQSRRDDVESWLYACCDFFNGKVPWHKLSKLQKSEILTKKKATRNELKAKFIGKMPQIFETIMASIDSWKFETRPTYQEFYSLLDSELMKLGCNYEDPYDWQLFSLFSSRTSTTSVKSKAKIDDIIDDVVSTQSENDSRTDKMLIK